jgi:hypothetical protein
MSYTKHLDTIKSREDRINFLSSTITAHTLAMNGVDPYNKTFIQQTIDRFEKEYKLLMQTNIRWNFNFKGGGWNSVVAGTKEQAIQIANKAYNDVGLEDGILVPDTNTFRVESEADNKALLSLFY